jgi:hypothetical protein
VNLFAHILEKGNFYWDYTEGGGKERKWFMRGATNKDPGYEVEQCAAPNIF